MKTYHIRPCIQKFLLSILSIILFFSCLTEQKSDRPQDNIQNSLGKAPDQRTIFPKAEVKLAYKFCQALNTETFYWKQAMDPIKYTYQIFNQDCQGNQQEQTVDCFIAHQKNGQWVCRQKNDRASYLIMETGSQGSFKEVCRYFYNDQHQRNNAFSEGIPAFIKEGTSKKEWHFSLNNDGTIRGEIKYALLQQNNKYIITHADAFIYFNDVRNNKSLRQGIMKEKYQYELCEDRSFKRVRRFTYVQK